MRRVRIYLVWAGLFLISCQANQNWSLKNVQPSRLPHRVGVRLPEFLPNRIATWAPLLKQTIDEHQRLTLVSQGAEFYLWASVDVDERSSIVNLSLSDAGGRVLALISSESSDFADRQAGRLIPDGAEAIQKEIKRLVGQLFPEDSPEEGGER